MLSLQHRSLKKKNKQTSKQNRQKQNKNTKNNKDGRRFVFSKIYNCVKDYEKKNEKCNEKPVFEELRIAVFIISK